MWIHLLSSLKQFSTLRVKLLKSEIIYITTLQPISPIMFMYMTIHIKTEMCGFFFFIYSKMQTPREYVYVGAADKYARKLCWNAETTWCLTHCDLVMPYAVN